MTQKTPAELYALGYAQYDTMLNEGTDITTARHLAAGLGQDMYAIGARTALGVHEERIAR